MSTFLEGDEDIISIWVTTEYVPIGCLTSNGLSESIAMRETVTKCDPGETIVKPGASTASISFDGIATTDSGVLSWAGLKTLHRAKTMVTWRVGKAAAYDYGTGYIESLDKEASAGEDVTFTGSIKVSGAIVTVDPEGI